MCEVERIMYKSIAMGHGHTKHADCPNIVFSSCLPWHAVAKSLELESTHVQAF